MKALLISLSLIQLSSGAIVYSGIQDITIPTTFDGVFVDLINMTSTTVNDSDFNNSQINFFFGGAGILTGERLRPVRSLPDQLSPIIRIGGGVPIDDSLVYGPVARGGSEDHIGTTSIQFPDFGEAYLGFLLDLNDDGLYSPGWMRVTLSQTGSVGTVHDWAYENLPGSSLPAGAIIPEPSALLLLGFAVSGLVFRGTRSEAV